MQKTKQHTPNKFVPVCFWKYRDNPELLHESLVRFGGNLDKVAKDVGMTTANLWTILYWAKDGAYRDMPVTFNHPIPLEYPPLSGPLVECLRQIHPHIKY